MKKTRWLAAVLAVLMLLALAACGSGGEKTPEATKAPEATKTPEATKAPEAPAVSEEPDKETYPLVEEPMTFTLWTAYSATSAAYIDSILEIPVFDKLEEKLNVFIDPTCVSSAAAKEAFNIMVGSGEEYDLINMIGMYYTGGVVGALNDGVSIDIRDYVYEYMPNFVARAQELGVEKDLVTDDGRMGAFYTLQSPGGSTMKTLGVAIRQDWLDALKLDMPTTYDEIHEFLKASNTEYGATMFVNYIGIANANELTAGYNICASESSGRQPLSVRDGVVEMDWLRDEFRDYLTMMNEWYEEGLIWPDFATGKHSWITFNDSAVSDLLAGKISIAQMELGDASTFPSKAVEDQSGMVLSAMPMPKLEENTDVHVIAESSKYGVGWVVTPFCENIDVICRYVDYMFTDEGAELCSFGIEGSSYNKVGDGYEFTELMTNDKDGRSVKTLFDIYMFDGQTCPFYCLSERNLLAYTEEAVNYGKVWASGHDDAYLLPSSLSATAEENDTWSAHWNEIDTYVVESMPKFIIGELDIEDDAAWQSFKDTIIEMGAEELVATKQAAYDRYLKR